MKELSSENFTDLDQIKKDENYIIVFSSTTCGPCQTMKPVLKALDENNKNILFFEIDTGSSPELASHFGVRGVPSIYICENREVLFSFSGVTPLRDLQYSIDNINDPYFREHGEFNIPKPQTDHTFNIVIIFIVITLVSAIIFL